MKRFEEIPHTADWSFRAYGANLRELFANAAHALFEMQGARAAENAQPITRRLHVDAIDREALLVNWLNELLFMQEKYREVYREFQIATLSSTKLAAKIIGKPRTKMDKLIKAVTFHNLQIVQTQNGWE
ncbi:MAG: archease, partial [Chloroflexi bacterium]|nr:archease [Chloroflexota bacterium]